MRLHHILLCSLFAITGCGPEDKPAPAAKPADAPKQVTPLVPKVEVHDWCKEHGVPESICTRCDENLIAGFKAKGDWCTKHSVPDSQCFVCHPELEAQFKAKAPKEVK